MTFPSPQYVGRFAPSPTGPLHWGSALAAFGSWLFAKKAGGEWLVRIEDLDPPREQEGAIAAQLATLERLGLHSDRPIVQQSQRQSLYRSALDHLLAEGHAFPCLCSRTDLAAVQGIHRACVSQPEGTHRTRSFRLRVDDVPVRFNDTVQGAFQQKLLSEVGDVILRRADGFWAYQLAVVVDDADQGISHVVRGADLLDSTPRQIALQRALGLPTPTYTHLPLWCDAEGKKLSKSEGAESLDAHSASEILRRCWQALGQDDGSWPLKGHGIDLLNALPERFTPALIPPTLGPIAATPRTDLVDQPDT